MSLLSNIKKWRKYRRLIKKIKDQLPHYHPEFGTELDWEVYLYRRVSKYDTKTGGPIAYSHNVPKLVIKQKPPPFNIIHDRNIYEFDWKKKKLSTKPTLSWSS